MNIPSPLRTLALAALLFTSTALHAQVPNVVNYQGRVAVGTTNFDGSGAFKFALVNAAGTTTFWSNDGTSTAGSQPTAAVTLTVTKGLYSVLLGDTTVPGMTLAIPASVWSNADVRLRVWFNDGTNGSQLLTPDQRLAPNGYLPDGGVSNAKLANATVTVSPGTGLTGGGAVALGAAITLNANTGAGANQLVALNGSAQLPALSGVNLTNLSGSNLTAGSVPLAALGSNSVDSAKIADGSIVNADINSAAGIAYPKLNLTGSIVNSDISAAAAIADTKLATISSAGKVSNSATTGVSTNTANTLVLRDAGGNFSAGTITASLAGNATTATTATTAATAGNVSGIVAIGNGGTGSPTQNFVDLSTAQSIAGTKSFTTNVGVGTAPNSKFHVNVASTDGTPGLRVQVDGNSKLTVANNGGVTIGTFNDTPPANGLLVGGTVTATSFSGDGSALTGITATIADGSVTAAKLAPGSAATNLGADPPSNVFPVLGMVWIRAGRFLMGSPVADPSSGADERPQTWVTFSSSFYMGVHEVTQREYLAVIGSNPSLFTGDTNRPVENVTWANANTYCSTLTTSERTAGRIPAGWGYRLPTEAEWEYCCRAAPRTTIFSYGDDWATTAYGNYAWFASNATSATHPVEQKQPNAWGLMDMHGNVWEWVKDFYSATQYPGGSVTDPQGPVSGTNHVSRGGSYATIALLSRCAQRRQDASPGNFLGFRVVLSSGVP